MQDRASEKRADGIHDTKYCWLDAFLSCQTNSLVLEYYRFLFKAKCISFSTGTITVFNDQPIQTG